MAHWELAKKYDIIDFELGVKITGAGFPVIKEKEPACNVPLFLIFLIKTQLQVIQSTKYLIL